MPSTARIQPRSVANVSQTKLLRSECWQPTTRCSDGRTRLTGRLGTAGSRNGDFTSWVTAIRRMPDLVELVDSFESNPGPKRGALVEARAGKGRWIYVGLGLWRQLPAGTTGAYKLLANLLSLGQIEDP